MVTSLIAKCGIELTSCYRPSSHGPVHRHPASAQFCAGFRCTMTERFVSSMNYTTKDISQENANHAGWRFQFWDQSHSGGFTIRKSRPIPLKKYPEHRLAIVPGHMYRRGRSAASGYHASRLKTYLYRLKMRMSTRITTTVPIPIYIFVSFDSDLACVATKVATHWSVEDAAAGVCSLAHVLRVSHALTASRTRPAVPSVGKIFMTT